MASNVNANDQLDPLPLPEGISSRYVNCKASVGLRFHILEAGANGYTDSTKPLLLLVHGYPEIAFSWRKVMVPLAQRARSYHVVAVDQRGYGRTTGWEKDALSYDETRLEAFSVVQLVIDMVALVHALGHGIDGVHCIIGHDFGGLTAASCALMRPDLFKGCVMMSHPFKGSPRVPGIPTAEKHEMPHDSNIHKSLAQLSPPRKHYKWDNSTKGAAEQWLNPPQGLHDFFRGYVHLKSATWKQNKPHALHGWTAPELAKMPHYYIMPLRSTMPEVVKADMQGEDINATTSWLNEQDLDAYVREWQRTGFQGALNWYRSVTSENNNPEMLVFAGKKLECPCTFVSGAQDWGNYQEPGALESYPHNAADYRGMTLIEGAGHWPQQEQPEKVVDAITNFLAGLAQT